MPLQRDDDYIFTIPNLKSKSYHLFALIITLVNLILFAVILVSSNITQERNFAIYGIAVPILGVVMEKIFKKKNETSSSLGYSLIIIASAWGLMGKLIPALGVLILTVLYFIAKRDLVIRINENRVSYPSFPSSKILWTDLTNMVLKDGLLTIDFKNNKLIQQMIDEHKHVNQEEFNDFCSKQLKTANP